jgi:hypothetical protein
MVNSEELIGTTSSDIKEEMLPKPMSLWKGDMLWLTVRN